VGTPQAVLCTRDILLLRGIADRLPDLFGSKEAQLASRFAQSELVEDATIT
jgi:hypothetical protein